MQLKFIVRLMLGLSLFVPVMTMAMDNDGQTIQSYTNVLNEVNQNI